MIRNIVFPILVILILWPVSVRAASASSLSIHYNIDAGLVFIDQLKRPNTSGDNIPYSDQFSSKKDGRQPNRSSQSFQLQESNEGSRTLGLKHFKLDFRIESLEDTALSFRLRPDAPLERQENSDNSEFDGRAGEVYRAAPAIELLDAYDISLVLGDQARMSAGVFQEIAPLVTSYQSPLEFGLMTITPQKVSGLKLEYETRVPDSPSAQAKIRDGAVYRVWIHNGARDRAEFNQSKSGSYDRAPSGADANMAMALGAQFDFDQRQNAIVTVGYGDTGISDGHVNELFIQLAYSRVMQLNKFTLKGSIDSRLSKERWDLESSRRPELEQQSLSLTALFDFGHDYVLAQGLHYGQSDRYWQDNPQKETFSGWQIDMGLIHKNFQHLNLGAFLSIESRKSSLPGNSDGFRSGSDSSSYLMRMALEIGYLLEGHQ